MLIRLTAIKSGAIINYSRNKNVRKQLEILLTGRSLEVEGNLDRCVLQRELDCVLNKVEQGFFKFVPVGPQKMPNFIYGATAKSLAQFLADFDLKFLRFYCDLERLEKVVHVRLETIKFERGSEKFKFIAV